MRRLFVVVLCVAAVLRCSPTTSDEENKGKPQTLTRSGDSSKPPVPLRVTMTSTGKVAAGLAKAALDSFTYPIKSWMPSSFYAGCPDYVDLNLTMIWVHGKWLNIKVHTDTIVYDTVIADSSKPKTSMLKFAADTSSAKKDSSQWWDTIVVKRDTVVEEEYRTLWTGNKTVRFDGSRLTLTNFDTLHIPQGTLYSLNVEAAQVAKVKGSISGRFTFGKQGDSVISKVKTYYTKKAYAWDAQTNAGGSADPSVFESGPAEEADIFIMQYDPNKVDSKGNGPNKFLRIESACTTAVGDSASLTILFDISRVLTFYNGDSVNSNQAPVGAPANKAYFHSHESFAGAGMSIATVFAGPVGTIEGYQAEYVWSVTERSLDADSAGPGLRNDTTVGGMGWLTLIYDARGTAIGGKMFQDNGTFCPKGTLTFFSAAEQRFDLGLNPAVFHVYGFKRGTSLGDVCFSRVFSPKWSTADGTRADARSGEVKFTLKLLQK